VIAQVGGLLRGRCGGEPGRGREALNECGGPSGAAEAVRAAGMARRDVLSIRVHVPRSASRESGGATIVSVAAARSERGMGLPLETDHSLASTLPAATLPSAAAGL